MSLLKSLLKKETGQALPMTLILLVLGGLLIVPMLSLMTTNLTANRIIEEENSGIYSADAGIQDALWKLGNGVDPFENGDSYVLTEDGIPLGTPVTVNGMTVTVDKESLDEGGLYTLKATATIDDEIITVIRAQAVAGSDDYSWLFDSAINTSGDLTTKNSDIIYGGVTCGGDFDDNADVRSGEIVEDAEVVFPPAQVLIDFYLNTFDPDVPWNPSNPYPDPSYTIPGGTDKDNPHMIPPIYCDDSDDSDNSNGDLTINGSGYGKLSGTIYATGQIWIAPGTTIDLNGHTIFSAYNSDPDCTGGDAINFQPNCFIFGPGCIIGVGSINYQPHAGTGDQLIGVDDSDTGTITTTADRFALYKFQADATGDMGSFQVKCSVPTEVPEAHVKVALYDDDGSGGAPGTLLRAADYADNITVISSWNPINIEDYELVNDQWYWLAAISDYPVISKKTVSSTAYSKYKSQAFSPFVFQSNPTELSTTNQTDQYMFRGFSYSQEFIFLMSIECSVNLQPQTSFYGSIAGDTNVNLQPHCTINLVDYDEGDLEFPGITGSSSGPGEGGDAPPVLNYNIQ